MLPDLTQARSVFCSYRTHHLSCHGLDHHRSRRRPGWCRYGERRLSSQTRDVCSEGPAAGRWDGIGPGSGQRHNGSGITKDQCVQCIWTRLYRSGNRTHRYYGGMVNLLGGWIANAVAFRLGTSPLPCLSIRTLAMLEYYKACTTSIYPKL